MGGKGGRPPGSKNSAGHQAGGDRRGPRFKARKKKEEEERARGNQRIREALAKAKQQASTPISVEHPLSEDNFKVSQKLLADVLDHPSMPKGKMVPTAGIITDNGNITYQNEASSKETDNQTFYRRKYMPDKGTPLRTFLDKAASEIKKNDIWKRRKYYHQTLESPLTYGLGSLPTPEKFHSGSLS